jgi:alkylation response protein AidB-like acyl-CoA dehydrogenase
MDLDFTAEEVAFRDEVRTWLAENVPRDERPDGGKALREWELAWQRHQYDAGWAGVAWPKEYGGRGLSLLELMIWYEEYARADAPQVAVTFAPRSSPGRPRSRRRTTCRRSCGATWPGVRGSRSRVPDRTWRRCRHARTSTATTSS